MPYKIVEGPHDDVRISLRDQIFSIPEISAYILQEMKIISEEYLGEEIKQSCSHRSCLLSMTDNVRLRKTQETLQASKLLELLTSQRRRP